jgi:acyl dehydratase
MDHANVPTRNRLHYLEDLAVGMRFVSAEHALDSAQIKAFAGQFDPQPFHLDEESARATLFEGLAASGWHTAALTMKLLVTSEFKIAGGLIGAGVELSWPTPTRPGDVLHVEGEVVDIAPSRSRPDRGIVTIACVTRNQHGDALQIMRSKLLVRRRGTV